MDTLVNIQNVIGTEFDDTIVGSNERNFLAGRAGDDQIEGIDGDDVLSGEAGSNRLYGGLGIDTVTYSWSEYGVTVDLAAGTGLHDGSSDGLQEIEIVIGSDSSDTLLGDGNANGLIGGEGNDTLDGRGGPDDMRGGPGDDTYIVDSFRDRVIEAAGEGTDTIALYVNQLSMNNRPNVENVTVPSGVRHWFTFGNDLPNVMTGNEGSNDFRGMAGNDTLKGAGGRDLLLGLDGNDSVEGGSGNDLLRGGNGNDTLWGGLGSDYLDGYFGSDHFIFASTEESSKAFGYDFIAGFDSPGPTPGDLIDLHLIDARPDLAGDQAFKLVTPAAQQWGGIWVFDHSYQHSTMVQGWVGPTPPATHGDWFQFWIMDGPNVSASQYTAEDFFL